MEEKVQHLMDRFEIQDVITRYSFGQDLHQGDDNDVGEIWKDVFTQDAILDYRDAGNDPTNYEQMIVNMRGDGDRPGSMSSFSNWQHLLGNPVVDIDGESALARTDLWASHKSKISSSPGTSLYVAGAFVDKLVKTQHGWRIAHRKLEIHFTDLVATQQFPAL